jgi:RimJ/RimL family protein N-acetyltransferase
MRDAAHSTGEGAIESLETPRLRLRPVTAGDAAFILELVNEPSWIRFIGDRKVHDLDDAGTYIARSFTAMYARHGLGLLLAERREDRAPLGICGLIKRESLPDVDLGFAFLPRHWSRGYAFEAARAVLEHGRDSLRLARIVAITDPENESSMRLLERLGFCFEKLLHLPEGRSSLFAIEFPAAPA